MQTAAADFMEGRQVYRVVLGWVLFHAQSLGMQPEPTQQGAGHSWSVGRFHKGPNSRLQEYSSLNGATIRQPQVRG
jgi:hypothetical protein